MITTPSNATIIFSFLIQKELPLDGVANAPQSEALQRATLPRRVLVIDDEMNIADSLVEILVSHGYDASAFYDGQTAIDAARSECPALVLADVMMPELNGIETVLAIRKHCPSTHVLLFSGQAGTADIVARARASGHDFEVLPKPIHPEELLKRLLKLEH